MTSPRYGIFSVDPYGPSAVNVGLGVADSLAKLRGQNALNTERELSNQRTTATQPGAIDFENFKNGFAQKSMPLAFQSSQDEAASKLLNDKSGRQEAAARALLYGRQANAVEQKNPLEFIRELQGVINTTDKSSPEYQYAYWQLTNILKDLGASPEGWSQAKGTPGGKNSTPIPAIPTASTITRPSGNGRMSMAPIDQNGMIVNPYSVSSRSMRGAEGFIQNPNGSYTYRSSPTTAAKTQNENRQAAESELNVLWDPVNKGYAPYQGAGLSPDASLLLDAFSAKFLGNKDAEKKLEQYALARMMTPEVANISARMSSGGPVGVEAMRELRDAQIQNPPSWLANKFIPQAALNAAANKYKPLQSEAVNAAVNTANSGYPITSNDTPYYGAQDNSWSFNDLIKGVRAPSPQVPQQQAKQQNSGPAYSMSDVDDYAKRNNMSPDQVRQMIIAKGGAING